MRDIYFFDIPIFRCSLEQHQRSWDQKNKTWAKHIFRHENPTETELKDVEKWHRHLWSSYRYGEMVGMLRLYAMGNQIRADLWFLKNKRLSNNLKNKKWAYYGKQFELTIYEDDSNKAIFQKVLQRVKGLATDDSLKSRFIDLEAFENVGKFVAYRNLMAIRRLNDEEVKKLSTKALKTILKN